MRFLLDHDVPVDVLPITAPDEEVFAHAQRKELTLISCNRAHFLALAERAVQTQAAFAGLIILIRRRSRQAECAQLLRLLRQAGESGLSGNVNFA